VVVFRNETCAKVSQQNEHGIGENHAAGYHHAAFKAVFNAVLNKRKKDGSQGAAKHYAGENPCYDGQYHKVALVLKLLF
jgi:hypothetical protein